MSDTCRLFPLFGDPWPSCLLPSRNCRDIVMVLIRKIIQILLRASLNCSVLLLPQRLSGKQAACRCVKSHQPVLWAPPLGDPLPWDQQSCQTPGSTAQASLQWQPQSSPESYSSGLNGPILSPGPRPALCKLGLARRAVCSAWNLHSGPRTFLVS